MKSKNIKSPDQIYFTKDHALVRKALRDFIKKEIQPNLDEWEESGQAPLHDLFKKMGDLGFLGIRYDEKYGGQGLDYWYDLVFLEELGRVQGSGVPMAIAVQSHMATPAIAEFGSGYLKETYLKPAIAGEMVASIAVTEPGAGSDLASLSCRAVLEGDHYVINGEKKWNTGGAVASYNTIFAVTNHYPATRQPLEDVRDEVRASLEAQQAEEVMAAKADEMLAALAEGAAAVGAR